MNMHALTHTMDLVAMEAFKSVNPTFKGRGCSSFIDFICVSKSFKKWITGFGIELSIFSDHNPLFLAVMDFTAQRNGRGGRGVVENVTDQGRQLRWSKNNGDAFYRTLVTDGKYLLWECVDMNVVGTSLVRAFEGVARLVNGLLQSTSQSVGHNDPIWFDKDCSCAQKEMKAALKTAPRD